MPGERGSADNASRGLPSVHGEGTAEVNVAADQLGELARSCRHRIMNDNNLSLRSVAHELAATGQWTVGT